MTATTRNPVHYCRSCGQFDGEGAHCDDCGKWQCHGCLMAFGMALLCWFCAVGDGNVPVSP